MLNQECHATESKVRSCCRVKRGYEKHRVFWHEHLFNGISKLLFNDGSVKPGIA